jgi:hypothetical protein
VIGPEGGAWSEGAAGVDVLVMSSSVSSSQLPLLVRAWTPAGARGEACSQRRRQWRTGRSGCARERAGLPYIGGRAHGEECGRCLGA